MSRWQKKVLPIHPDPLADVHRTCNLLLPLASARCDMVFQTSNNNKATTKKKNHEREYRKNLFFSPWMFSAGVLHRRVCPTRFVQGTRFNHQSHTAHVACTSQCLKLQFFRPHTRDDLFFLPDPPSSLLPLFTRPNKQTRLIFFIFFSSSSHCHFLFPTAQTNHRHSRFLAKGPQKRRQIRQNRQTKDMHQIQDPMQ